MVVQSHGVGDGRPLLIEKSNVILHGNLGLRALADNIVAKTSLCGANAQGRLCQDFHLEAVELLFGAGDAFGQPAWTFASFCPLDGSGHLTGPGAKICGGLSASLGVGDATHNAVDQTDSASSHFCSTVNCGK
jgi:hypothetical protein